MPFITPTCFQKNKIFHTCLKKCFITFMSLCDILDLTQTKLLDSHQLFRFSPLCQTIFDQMVLRKTFSCKTPFLHNKPIITLSKVSEIFIRSWKLPLFRDPFKKAFLFNILHENVFELPEWRRITVYRDIPELGTLVSKQKQRYFSKYIRSMKIQEENMESLRR